MAMCAEHNAWVTSKVFARGAEHGSVLFRRGIADGVGKIDDAGTGACSRLDYFEEIGQIASAGIFRGKFHFIATHAAIANHFCHLVEGLCARNAQLMFQMQVRRGQENVQTRPDCGFESAQRRIDIFQARAS